MRRVTSAVDRTVAAVVGLALIALGLGALAGSTDLVADFPDMITAPAVVDATSKRWWPWAVGAAGVILVLAGISWLLTHTPASRAHAIRLPVVGSSSSATADLDAVAEAAAASLARRPDVTGAKGRAINERGRRTVVMDVTISTDAGLAPVADAIDRTCRHIVRTLGTDDFAIRTLVHRGSGRRGRALR